MNSPHAFGIRSAMTPYETDCAGPCDPTLMKTTVRCWLSVAPRITMTKKSFTAPELAVVSPKMPKTPFAVTTPETSRVNVRAHVSDGSGWRVSVGEGEGVEADPAVDAREQALIRAARAIARIPSLYKPRQASVPREPRRQASTSGGDVTRPRRVRLMRDRCSREWDAEHADLPLPEVREGEVRDVQTLLVEGRARREVHRVTSRAAVSRCERPGRREHLDLVRLVGADVEVARHVELDAVSSVERTGRTVRCVERGTVGEDRDRAGRAVCVHRDAQDAIGRGIGDVQERLGAIECDAVRSEGRIAPRCEEGVLLPQRLAAAVRAHGVDRAGERIGDVERARVILSDRVRRQEACGKRCDGAGRGFDADKASAA